MLAKDPVAMRCPLAGWFKFKQMGDLPFKTRILGGVTDSPRPQFRCYDSASTLQICDSGQKEITIDADHCLSVDTHGRPVDIYSITYSFSIYCSSLLLETDFQKLIFYMSRLKS